MKNRNLEFEFAKQGLIDGLMVRRSTWPLGHFIFRQVPSTIGKDIVPKMQSLRTSVKTMFLQRFENGCQVQAISYNDQFAYVNERNMRMGYSPSVSDTMADDWEILE